MKKSLALGVVVVLVAAQYLWYSRSREAWDRQAQAGELTIHIATAGTDPPFNFVDAKGQLRGFDVDIARALCDRMRAKCEIVQESSHTLISNLRNRKYDAIASAMPITPDLQRIVSFTNRYARISTGGPHASDSDIGIAVRKRDVDLLNAFNGALRALREDGGYKRVNDRYFNFDIYGG
jgi:ABC-type amino acid transport substrate-binding protein